MRKDKGYPVRITHENGDVNESTFISKTYMCKM